MTPEQLADIAARRVFQPRSQFGQFASDALDALVGFYDEANRSLRLTLAALQSAVDHAADLGASSVRAAHVLVGAEEWRSHVDLS